MIKFKRHSNSPQYPGRITSHPTKTFFHGTLFKFFCILYVDDVAFAFDTRKYMERGSNPVLKYFNRLGLQMHIGSKSKLSKTKCVCFLAPGHVKLPTPTSSALPTYSSSSLPETLKQNNENGGTRQKIYDQKYDNIEEAKPILIGESGMTTFTRHFKYLGS